MNFLLLPVFVSVVLACMLVPLPGLVMDSLLVINVIIALVILLATFSIKKVLHLSAFPTLILLATIYRLALNIGTTRLILDKGKVGELVQGLGELIMNQNPFMGLTVFTIILVIQLIVIAKGAERVAEVSARFALDAMPGRQMAIDAELRSGGISLQLAHQRRTELQEESRFYGALDGSMKFVKGDALAGILITSVNLLGGLFSGVYGLNLPISVAFSKYCMLTVGDGLVSQIPALMNALSAGVIVTRVGDGESLSATLGAQLYSLKGTIAVISLLSACLPVLIGLSFLPITFIAVSMLAFLFSYEYWCFSKKEPELPSAISPSLPPLIQLEVPGSIVVDFKAFVELVSAIENWRNEYYKSTGVLFPQPTLVKSSNKDELSLSFRGVLLKQLSLDSTGSHTSIILKVLELLQQIEGMEIEFIDDTFSQRILDSCEATVPGISEKIIPDLISITQFTSIIRALVREEVPIRNIDVILQTIAEKVPAGSLGRSLLAEVRVSLGRFITSKYQVDGTLSVIRFDHDFDSFCAECEERGTILSQQVIDFLVQALNESCPKGRALLVSRESRLLVREVLVSYGFNIPVIAYEEVSGFPVEVTQTLSTTKELFHGPA